MEVPIHVLNSGDDVIDATESLEMVSDNFTEMARRRRSMDKLVMSRM